MKFNKYNEFILECRSKDYSGMGTHRHHIIPKFMGGTDKSENLIILSYQDHFDAHIILAECFEKNEIEYYKNMYSATRLLRWVECGDDFRLKLKEINTGKNNPMYGKDITDEHRKRLSASNAGEKNNMYGKTHTPDAKKKISDRSKLLVHNEATREKMRNSKKMFETTDKGKIQKELRLERWKTQIAGRGRRTDEDYKIIGKKISEAMGRKCDIDGTLFKTVREVSECFGISTYKVHRRIKSAENEWKDWNYV